MNGLIIITSMVFAAYVVCKIVNVKIKYILAPIISLLYGAMLFFIGMGLSYILFLVIAIIPVVAGVFYMFK